MRNRPHTHYSFETSTSSFSTKYIKVSPASFSTKFKQVGATAPIPEQGIIIYDGGDVEGWEAENGETV